MTHELFEEWLEGLRAWAQHRDDLAGVAIVGSHARGAASDSSDVDVVLVADERASYLDRQEWLAHHGVVKSVEREDYGLVQSLRVVYASGEEVEWGLTDRAWCALPPDPGTAGVIAAGMRIVHDRDGDLAALQRSVFAAALAALAGADDDETPPRFRAVVAQLVNVKLLIAEGDLVETDEGEELLPLFTDAVELFAFDPGATPTSIAGEEAIRRVAAGEHDGLIINPEGQAFELSRDDVLEVFAIDEDAI